MNFKARIKTLFTIIYLKMKYPQISFRIINTPFELEKMYELIWQVYAIEKRYIHPKLFSKEILVDEFEEYSIKIGAFFNKELIGALRIILPSPRGFYVEKDFNVELGNLPKNKIAEISRLVVRKDWRNKIVALCLLKKAFDECKKRKIKYWIVVISKEMKDRYERGLGIKFQTLKTTPLTKEQLKIREKMKNYYFLNNPIPYLIHLDEI